MGRLLAAALALGALATGASGCGGHRPRPAALRLERADLVLLAHSLQRLRPAVAGEVAAARTVWLSLAGGLPPAASSPAAAHSLAGGSSPGASAARAGGAAPPAKAARGTLLAARRAAALTLPSAVIDEGAVTGPAATLAGMLQSYARLSQRGWRYLAAALTAPSPPRARGRAGGRAGRRRVDPHFLRANAPLYVYCVYDGHYDLSLIGKTLLSAYRALGGAAAFGGTLTPGEVNTLAGAYSIPAARLQPHPGPGVVV
ncbi:MAG TPA: hypothetical protein VNV37_12715 [Solirubrobacteraceae bacterium]|nr:hypothetical protein [Solirubrobacteraceae bacterium]